MKKTFECGQCFRWYADEKGVYTGVALGNVLSAWTEKGGVYLSAPETDREKWLRYFDLEDGYSIAEENFRCSEYMEKCMEQGAAEQ